MTRNRLTDQSIVDIAASRKAELTKVAGGYHVEVGNRYGLVTLNDKHSRPVIWTSKEAAKKALLRHNDDIDIVLKTQVPVKKG